jgi:hypothetical protein
MSKLPIADVKTLYSAVALAITAEEALRDNGGVDAGDLADLPKVFDAVRAFGAVDFTAVLPELADLDAAEAADLDAHARAVFKLPAAPTVEQVIETVNGVVLQFVAVVNAWRGGTAKVAALKGAAA